MPKICSDEYDKFTCIFIGVQTEVSVIALDLTMVISHFTIMISCSFSFLILCLLLTYIYTNFTRSLALLLDLIFFLGGTCSLVSF
jgi:hypothetical protein